MEGATSYIVETEEGYVIKRYRWGKKNPVERAMHARVAALMPTDLPIRAPKLLPHPTEYLMERVDTSQPLWEEHVWDSLDAASQALFLKTVQVTLLKFAEHSLVMRDVEVYLQPDKTLIMLDFGQVYSGHTEPLLQSAAVIPEKLKHATHPFFSTNQDVLRPQHQALSL
jgi:hypothetical protein